MRKGSQGDHNIPFQNNCNHQEDHIAPLHTEVAGDKLCQQQASA